MFPALQTLYITVPAAKALPNSAMLLLPPQHRRQESPGMTVGMRRHLLRRTHRYYFPSPATTFWLQIHDPDCVATA